MERTCLPSLVLAHASPQGGVLCCPDRFTAGADNLNPAVLPVPSEQPPLQVLLHACKRRRYRGRKRSATDREDPAARIPSHLPSGMRLNQLQSCTVPAHVRFLSRRLLRDGGRSQRRPFSASSLFRKYLPHPAHVEDPAIRTHRGKDVAAANSVRMLFACSARISFIDLQHSRSTHVAMSSILQLGGRTSDALSSLSEKPREHSSNCSAWVYSTCKLDERSHSTSQGGAGVLYVPRSEGRRRKRTRSQHHVLPYAAATED